MKGRDEKKYQTSLPGEDVWLSPSAAAAMRPVEIRRTVARLRSERQSVVQRRETGRASLDEAVTADDRSAVVFLRSQLAQLDAAVADLDERIGIFNAKLPTAETIRAAQAEADARLARLAEIARRVSAATHA